MRVAIVHYWLLRMRGGEKVLELLCRLLPDADIFTLFYDPERISPAIRSHRVRASFLNPLRRFHRDLLPLMPLALENFDLRGYDLIVSSESGPAKGVLAPSTAHHVCYCHSPMRYLWDLYPAYLHEWTRWRWKRALIAPLAGYLRLWDYASAARVDEFIANSRNVSRRIWKAYRREANVIYPGIPVENFYWKPAEDYYLVVSELVPYKRIDTAVRLFSKSGRRLVIAGEGPEYKRLKKLARPNVELCGHVSGDQLRELYARSRALILPGEEDFGMTTIEALASGKPVVALGRGGALETVPARDPLGGVLYSEPIEEQLAAAIATLEASESRIRPAELQAFAARFSEHEFLRKMHEVLAPWITAGTTSGIPR
jgi:glycosyltransferase involved in cell wall biosynthesis